MCVDESDNDDSDGGDVDDFIASNVPPTSDARITIVRTPTLAPH